MLSNYNQMLFTLLRLTKIKLTMASVVHEVEELVTVINCWHHNFGNYLAY